MFRDLIILFPVAYVAGSVNFSIILFLILGKGDPRDQFSRNPGVTNVYRQAGKLWALVVLFLDIGRAAILAIISLNILPNVHAPLIGLGLILGNLFPCFHRFQGGKGVANYLGFCAVLAPLWAFISMISWALAFYVTRLPFIGSFFMVFFLSLGVIVVYNGNPFTIIYTVTTAFTIYWAHKSNVIKFYGLSDK